MIGEPVRATFMSLYGRPESDAEFVQSVAGGGKRRAVVVDGFSCRQMYLRSYTFSTAEKKEQSMPEKTMRCLERVKDHAGAAIQAFPVRRLRRKIRQLGMWEEKKKSINFKSCTAAGRQLRRVTVFSMRSIFRRLLSCTTTIDLAAGCSSRPPASRADDGRRGNY